ncbi:MAG: lipoate--protein ligase family protein [candidate division KSB1 bacterium]|nr:lipoate--protein ligase family protein [candidate division KSB1 bacterium]MDZ7304602.1 lipoate--protein ligase family protein [candidate division KSB1 bacterium]MDZ7313735.1 lipoate--protein ligase family protein [candidate division KSB1 bacterium]
MRWRFLNTGAHAGDYNMALDAALVQSGASKDPALRVFQWDPHCISLGYHQHAGEIDLAKCEKAGIDVVRRPTAGRAILHAQEVTYSVVIPATHPWFEILPLDLYRRLSEAIAVGLRYLGAEVNFAPGEKLQVNGRPLRTACFASAARNELLASGKKIVGSAQRRFREGALQHGSILLDDAHDKLPDFLAGEEQKREIERRRLADHTTTLRKVCSRTVAWDEVVWALRRGFSEMLHMDFYDSPVLEDENQLAETWRDRFQILKTNPKESK